MICKVFDDLFDRLFIHELDHIISNKLKYEFNNVGNRTTWPYGYEGSYRLMGCTLFERENLNRITKLNKEAPIFFDIFERIENNFLTSKYLLNAIQINIQHSGCNGDSHIDSVENHLTIMLMTNSKWDTKWGGQFQVLNNDESSVIEEHDYVPGRLIIFPSHVPHRGLGPSEKYPYIYRQTLVFRVQPF